MYHLMARGIRRMQIFDDEGDRQVFMNGMRLAFTRFNCRSHAYCLMTNHFHILLETDEVTVSKVMKQLLQNYAMYYNKKMHYKGHLFEGRYVSCLVDTDEYFLQVSRYIHLNPVKARIVETPEAYKWSSYQTIIGMEDDGITDIDRIMSYFEGENPFSYRNFTEDASDRSAEAYDAIRKSMGEDEMGFPE